MMFVVYILEWLFVYLVNYKVCSRFQVRYLEYDDKLGMIFWGFVCEMDKKVVKGKFLKNCDK